MLSIIIIAYEEELYLPGLLDSLLGQTWKDFEIIIVDSGSMDRTVEVGLSYRERFSRLRLIELGEARGPAYARNQGAACARYERLLFLDADTVLEPDFLERAVSALKTFGAHTASCFLRIPDAGWMTRSAVFFLNASMLLLRPLYISAFGACLFSTKRVHRSVGGFSEDLAICEDCDYVKRARQTFGYRYRILGLTFGTSDRRAGSEGGLRLMLKYIRAHTYRMLTGREILKGSLSYEYGKRRGKGSGA